MHELKPVDASAKPVSAQRRQRINRNQPLKQLGDIIVNRRPDFKTCPPRNTPICAAQSPVRVQVTSPFCAIVFLLEPVVV
ncbi:hypothetical protein [Paraburkholderia sp.]|uniref:hypothetical protein n=1 Tax=Paraburkholderia sp. TaxID=1926495 RepID=UPI0023875A13|nr:hypothetical protein [Paraburkholderia sp.]MDE1181891.1 hypothetical protein [Paraburkholderia sp.]